MNTDEKQLFYQVSQGDERAFQQLFHRYNKQLLPFVYKLTSSQSAAEEIVQDVFIKIWTHREKLAEIEVPRAWIIRIVSNLSYNWLRKQATDGKLLNKLKERQQEESISPQDVLAAKEVNRLLKEGIDQLPTQMKQVFRLSKEQGLSIPEIAGQLHVSPNTVKNQLVTALKRVRAYVRDHMGALLSWLIALVAQKIL